MFVFLSLKIAYILNPLPHREHFWKQSRPRVYSVCIWKYDISEPTLVDLTCNSLVPSTNMKIYLYYYS